MSSGRTIPLTGYELRENHGAEHEPDNVTSHLTVHFPHSQEDTMGDKVRKIQTLFTGDDRFDGRWERMQGMASVIVCKVGVCARPCTANISEHFGSSYFRVIFAAFSENVSPIYFQA